MNTFIHLIANETQTTQQLANSKIDTTRANRNIIMRIVSL